jgi:hypothetical protein
MASSVFVNPGGLGTVTILGDWTFEDPVHLPAGSATAPALPAPTDADSGLYFAASSGSTQNVQLAAGGAWRMGVNGVGAHWAWNFPTTGAVSWSTSATDPSAAPDFFLARQASNELALHDTTAAMLFSLFGYRGSATAYAAGGLRTALASLTLSGATTTATALIPVGAFLVGVATTTTTTITGATGYAIGDGSDPDRWGSITGTAVGTDSDNTDATADPTGYFAAANDVVLTALTSNFTGGVVQVVAFYLTTAGA